jgi:DNA-binding HxlR family transcriptional regulator
VLPVLAALDGSAGSRFVPLAHRLGASRDALREALGWLNELGLVMRNPGYGHPSRPEYVLTERGRDLAPRCSEVACELRRLKVEGVGLKKWTLPTLTCLDRERRHHEIADMLGATSRALSLALKDLVAAELVERRVHDGFPPTTTYIATERGSALRKPLTALDEAL